MTACIIHVPLNGYFEIHRLGVRGVWPARNSIEGRGRVGSGTEFGSWSIQRKLERIACETGLVLTDETRDEKIEIEKFPSHWTRTRCDVGSCRPDPLYP